MMSTCIRRVLPTATFKEVALQFQMDKAIQEHVPRFIREVERLNGMTLEDLYITAIDRPGDFGVHRRAPGDFGRVLVDEAFGLASHRYPWHYWSPPPRAYSGKGGVYAYAAPPFLHRLPNAKWTCEGAFDDLTIVLHLEGVQHFGVNAT